MAQLPPALDKFVLVHLSDLHINPWITPARFAEVVEMVNKQQPDLIAITGDFIDARTAPDQVPAIIEQLSRLDAREGVFAVLGNHDHWNDAGLVRQILESSGVKELPNRVEAINRDQDRLYVCGLDDHRESKDDLDAVLEALPAGEFAILLMHEPDFADTSSKTGRFALQLSGHSHGGQVYLPLYGAPVTPKLARKYPRGLYDVGGMQLYTTTGIGMVPPFVRFNCRPEVAVITLSNPGLI
jgi:predicted MPP superfamily phosphohydrolase